MHQHHWKLLLQQGWLVPTAAWRLVLLFVCKELGLKGSYAVRDGVGCQALIARTTLLLARPTASFGRKQNLLKDKYIESSGRVLA
jgi:hypothetical protein